MRRKAPKLHLGCLRYSNPLQHQILWIIAYLIWNFDHPEIGFKFDSKWHNAGSEGTTAHLVMDDHIPREDLSVGQEF